MLVGGGWTYTSIIDTKKELKAKTGTALEPAGPSGKDTAFAGGSHLVVFQDSDNKDLANAFVDFMLQPGEPDEVHGRIGFLPGTVAGIKASGYLDDPLKKPFAEQLLDHSAVYPPSPRWGALEGANIFDGEIQKVMKGKETPQDAAKTLQQKMDEEFQLGFPEVRAGDTGGSTAVAGRAVRAPRPRPLAVIERALSRLTLPVLLLLPALTIITALVAYPLGRTIYMSFTDMRLRNLIRGGETWVGLDNYKEAFTDGHLAASLVNTVVFGTACVIGTMVFGFAVALLLDQKLKGNVFFGLAVLLPWAVPAIAASAIWRWLFNDRYGFVNWGLTSLGLTTSRTTPGSPTATPPTSRSSSRSSGSRSRSSRSACGRGCRRCRRTRSPPRAPTARAPGSASGWSRSRCCARSSPCS